MKSSKSVICALICATGFTAGQAGATLDISQQPLIIGGFVEPNILYILDDSLSMVQGTMPDELTYHFNNGQLGGPEVWWTFPMNHNVHLRSTIGANVVQRRVPRFRGNVAALYRSAQFNAVYYNPAITYRPWVDAHGNEMPDAVASSARNHPLPDLDFGTRNLTVETSESAHWINENNGNDGGNSTITYYPATYYYFTGGDGCTYDSPADFPLGTASAALPDEENCYDLVEIRSVYFPRSDHGRENRTDCGEDGSCSYLQEIQNFANWYQYHRDRAFVAKAGTGRAFAEQSSRMRVGFGTINTGISSVDGVNTQTVTHGVRRFEQAQREVFFDALYDRDTWLAGTPLRQALQGAGRYYERGDVQGPWSDTPGETTSGENPAEHLACRQSYTVLMTDGYWNDFTPVPLPGVSVGNVDGSHGQPFSDNWGNTLADVAMYYWDTDLRDDLDDLVPSSRLNPNTRQHMVTFGVGLGVEGTLDIDPEEIFDAIRTGENFVVNWPNPIPNDAGAAKIDDLLHAAVNSRGGFFSANDAGEFSHQLSRVLQEIVARAGSSTAFSVSSSRINADSLVFQAEFGSDPWWGDLAAISPHTGQIVQRASDSMPPWTSRNIYTSEDTNRLDFDPGSLSPELLERIAPPGEENNGALINAIVEYVVGNTEHEAPDTTYNFRARGGNSCGTNDNSPCVIGDIINSQLFFAGKRNEGWARLDAEQGGGGSGAGSYGEFFNNKFSRDDIIYVGANSGMLHAFNAQVTGDDNPTVSLQEMFAYIPNAVLDNLHELTNPDYGHRFFVDGQVTVGDVRLGTQWRTVLIGTLGAGGQAVYALDVTNPGNPQVLWEVSSDDPGFENLGYTFGTPAITRLSDGTWVAVFGNGYKSGNPENEAEYTRPSLFVVPINNPQNVTELVVPDSAPVSNGLSSPAIVLDTGTRSFARRAYAGDLDGNIWRFDLEENTVSRLFQDPDHNAITAKPELSVHAGGGIMVYFGTGKLFENDDARITADEPVRTIFAVRDRGGVPIDYSELAEIVIAEEDDIGRRRVETSSSNFESGWRLDLILGDNNNGERVLQKATVGAGNVLVATFEPSDNICVGGGLVRLYLLNALSGIGNLDEHGWASVEIPIGAPIAPPIAILPPPQSTGSSDSAYAPGDNENVPPLPEPDPDDPNALRGERSQWCGSIGYWHPIENEFVSIATLCEGRQVWREVR